MQEYHDIIEHETASSDPDALTLYEYTEIHKEIEEQPHWRYIADREMDYADGNQLDGDLLREQARRGIPPAIEDMIGPALMSIQGYESATRTDWRVTPDGDSEGQDVADALNYRLNQAERQAKADRACSHAFRAQIACGIGWVEVSRESDPFKFPYRCKTVHRNEIHWDMRAQEPDLSDARWLRRQRWLHVDRVALAFPDHEDMLRELKHGGAQSWLDQVQLMDGGSSTGLNNAWGEGRAWTEMEQRWYNQSTAEVLVMELWYRRWVRVPVLKTQDGRAVEYDESNLAHSVALASGRASIHYASVARLRRSFWVGPLCLHDGPSPYAHRHFPYVPFWGFREDQTGVPYGFVRAMKYAQDSINSGISKLRWGMSAYRVERTKGAVAMSDEQFRRQIGRSDADIVLDPRAMSQQGARFEVKRDYQLTDQHYQMLNDNRASIERVSNITAGFQGRQGTATSGLQEQTQVEQSNQHLGFIMDNFRDARAQVGELLMSMIIEDLGEQEHTIIIEGNAVTPDRAVTINKPETDEMGYTYLSNDLKRTRLKVALEEVPSSQSYRSQQLNALTEAIKPLPQEYLAAAVPFLTSLMDVPFKRDLVEAFRQVGQSPGPEQIEQMLQEAKQQAVKDAGLEIKSRELELKERKADSEIKGLDAKAVQIGVQAAFSAMQAGAQIAQMPMIAPIADEVMKGAGYQRPNPAGHDPNFPVPGQVGSDPVLPAQAAMPEGMDMQQEGMPAEFELPPGVNQNTSPAFPPVPDDGASPMQGIETQRITDNLPAGEGQ